MLKRGGLLAGLLAAAGFSVSHAAADPVTTAVIVLQPAADYRRIFDDFDAAYEPRRAKQEADNSRGKLAWLVSYRMQAYMQMYRSTGDREYLRKLARCFDAILPWRDDRLGRLDEHTSRALAGWGSSSYNRDGAKWHVFIVHTGMITLGPAEFVRAVKSDPSLQGEFGTSATVYQQAIAESIRDAEPYWHDGPGSDEGYYSDPALGLLPLNQSNALGCVLLEMHEATGDTKYLERARRLAHFFRNRLRRVGDHYQWAYWPKEKDTEKTTEDISHAAINMDFAVRCARRNLVFTPEDISLFARTWLRSVRRPDGTWAGYVGGTGSSEKYMPGSAGRWLVLAELLEPGLKKELYDDVARAYQGATVNFPSEALGIAHLLRFR